MSRKTKPAFPIKVYAGNSTACRYPVPKRAYRLSHEDVAGRMLAFRKPFSRAPGGIGHSQSSSAARDANSLRSDLVRVTCPQSAFPFRRSTV